MKNPNRILSGCTFKQLKTEIQKAETIKSFLPFTIDSYAQTPSFFISCRYFCGDIFSFEEKPLENARTSL